MSTETMTAIDLIDRAEGEIKKVEAARDKASYDEAGRNLSETWGLICKLTIYYDTPEFDRWKDLADVMYDMSIEIGAAGHRF